MKSAENSRQQAEKKSELQEDEVEPEVIREEIKYHDLHLEGRITDSLRSLKLDDAAIVDPSVLEIPADELSVQILDTDSLQYPEPTVLEISSGSDVSVMLAQDTTIEVGTDDSEPDEWHTALRTALEDKAKDDDTRVMKGELAKLKNLIFTSKINNFYCRRAASSEAQAHVGRSLRRRRATPIRTDKTTSRSGRETGRVGCDQNYQHWC